MSNVLIHKNGKVTYRGDCGSNELRPAKRKGPGPKGKRKPAPYEGEDRQSVRVHGLECPKCGTCERYRKDNACVKCASYRTRRIDRFKRLRLRVMKLAESY